MSSHDEVVITGLGVVSPLGCGADRFWSAMRDGQSGVRNLELYEGAKLPIRFGAAVTEFDPKQYVKPRKSLKVMTREIQFAFAAASMASSEAAVSAASVAPERLGVVFGSEFTHCDLHEIEPAFRACLEGGSFDFAKWGTKALEAIHPLWMLKYLPNMPACHVGIALDARGPNNSVTLGDVSSLMAIDEAYHVLKRGQADVMIAGGTGSRLHPTTWVRSFIGQVSHHGESPRQASRPFDRRRDGMVNGEGAAAIVLERFDHAKARGAKIIARLRATASRFEPRRPNEPLAGHAIKAAIQAALEESELTPRDIGHVNAHGLSTQSDDKIEAQAIRAVLDDVPVFAPKSYFGHLGAGGGCVELVASLLAMQQGVVPVTLNYENPDPDCPVNVVSSEPLLGTPPVAMVLNHAPTGQASSVIVSAAS